jgi:hypothetical protein
MSTPATGEEHRAAQADVYGRYRAKETIFVDGARAFNVGDLVPASHVTRGIVDPDQVEDITDTKKKG